LTNTVAKFHNANGLYNKVSCEGAYYKSSLNAYFAMQESGKTPVFVARFYDNVGIYTFTYYTITHASF
jgi:hypothetical protein